MFRSPGLVATALLVAGPLAAQAPDSPGAGTISGRLGGEDALWYIAGGETSDTGWREIEGGYVLTLYATPQAEAATETGALTVTIALTGGPAELETQSAEFEWVPPEGDSPLVASGQNVDLSVEALQVQGNSMTIAASFLAYLTPGGADGLVLRAEDGVQIEGDLQATVFAE